ncbi:fumarylacetoacetate hydrolase family protein [Actinomadura madurae]|uniref:fumarylacetoacetate hydrolase family protein n=1 Tax=Actinomadura madurae TaxID=1993 RepID=UPI00399A1FD1
MTHLATAREESREVPIIIDPARGVLRPQTLLQGFTGDAMELLTADMEIRLLERVAGVADRYFEDPSEFELTVPYRAPRKILGIGLNYREHAGDLDESAPEEPASFFKGDHTIIGAGDTIVLPEQSGRVTTEGELGLIIGRTARDVPLDAAMDYVWGFCTVLDQTAEDILRRNPRFLTRCKNFPTFFSFGPALMPARVVRDAVGSFERIVVETIVNGTQIRSNTVANMTHGLASLVSFHSEVMPLYPGDIISTGTPGAIPIEDGDVAECRIEGVGRLSNSVRRRDR